MKLRCEIAIYLRLYHSRFQVISQKVLGKFDTSFNISMMVKSMPLKLFSNHTSPFRGTVKLGNKERFDKEQIGIKEPFPVTNLQFTS